MSDPTPASGRGELAGKVALVTGAARGQGRAIAHRLAAEGARIVATDVLSDDLADLPEEIARAARSGEPARAAERAEPSAAVLAVEHDVSDPAGWAAVTDQAIAAFGRLDILVNNAGVLHQCTLGDETPEQFEKLWRINCLGAFLGIQAVVPHLRRAGGGAIVNTLSTAAMSAWSHHGAYVSSKWALRGLTKVAALELAPEGIRVNAVCPGPIATPMVLPHGDTPEARKRLARTPMGRMGESDEIAEAVLYLVSDRAAFVAGAELAVDGGMLAGTLLAAGPARDQ